MALKITLKPHERLIIGGAVLTNGAAKAEFRVENTVPILRQKNILSAEGANSPARRIYFAVQLMYVDEPRIIEHQKLYWQLVRDFIEAAPRAIDLVDRINEWILKENYYQALKTAQQLIDYEQEVIDCATKRSEELSIS